MTIIRTQTHERRDTDPVDYILQFIKDTKRLKKKPRKTTDKVLLII